MADERYTPPWVPIDIAWWEVISASLAKPWPREAVWFDLRFWNHRTHFGVLRPGRPALQTRWGWTEGKARAIIAYMDAAVGERPRVNLRRTPTRPALILRSLEASATPEKKSPGTSSAASNAPEKTSSPKKIEVEQEVELDSDSRPAVRPGELPAPVLSALGKHEKKPLAAQVKGINARLKAGATVAEIVAVIEWAYTSAHKTAVFNREQGNHRSLTPWRPDNFDRYLAFATASPSGTYATESLFVPPVNTTTNDDDIPF